MDTQADPPALTRTGRRLVFLLSALAAERSALELVTLLALSRQAVPPQLWMLEQDRAVASRFVFCEGGERRVYAITPRGRALAARIHAAMRPLASSPSDRPSPEAPSGPMPMLVLAGLHEEPLQGLS